MIQEHAIQKKLDTVGMNAATFCAIAGVSHSKWSRSLRGTENWNGDTLLRLSRLIEEIIGLARDAEPFVLSFKDADKISRLLEWRRAGLRLIPIPVGPKDIVLQFEVAGKPDQQSDETSLVSQ
jgi:hypothetical protein